MIQAATPKELADAVRRTLKAHRFQMEDATRLGMARDNLKAGNACAALYPELPGRHDSRQSWRPIFELKP